MVTSFADAPRIYPVPPGVSRPRWSVMIPTYNCANFLGQTLVSVLAQDLGEEQMQIEVVDDRSTLDDPLAVIRKLGGCRVGFYRQQSNVGIVGNFNTCLQRSRGELVHVLHGDDYVASGFYDQVESAARAHPEIALFAVRSRIVDENGKFIHFMPLGRFMEKPTRDASELLYGNCLMASAVVIRRSFYEIHGGFLPVLKHVADWEMWARATGRGGRLYLKEPLAIYRFFSGNDTSRLMQTAENLRDHLRLRDIMILQYPTFDRHRFNSAVAMHSRLQTDRFRKLNLPEAYACNRAFLHELVPRHERWLQTVRLMVRGIIVFVKKLWSS
jgi:glycosyltransferase involved in cell wall biosynthesis